MINTIFKRFIHWLESRYSTAATLFLLAVSIGFLWAFNFSTFPISNPELIKLSGQEGLLDLMPHYSAQEMFTAMDHYGIAGRDLYMNFLAADFIFIPTYGFAFAFLMLRLVRAVCGEKDTLSWLVVLPFVIGLFDITENLSTLTTLIIYPQTNMIIGTIAGYATMIKHILTLLALLILGVGGIVVVLQRMGINLCSLNLKKTPA